MLIKVRLLSVEISFANVVCVSLFMRLSFSANFDQAKSGRRQRTCRWPSYTLLQCNWKSTARLHRVVNPLEKQKENLVIHYYFVWFLLGLRTKIWYLLTKIPRRVILRSILLLLTIQGITAAEQAMILGPCIHEPRQLQWEVSSI